jgi:hypothetical protein
MNERYNKYKYNEFKDEIQRMNILKEIIFSERSYLISLSQVISLYLLPLRKNKILNEKEILDLFSNIEEIKRVSFDFLNKLDKEYLHTNMKIGKIFFENLNNFKICIFYFILDSKYYNDFEISTEIYKGVKKNLKFKEFLDYSIKINSISELSFYLIMPGKPNSYSSSKYFTLKLGLPRYKLLLSVNFIFI